LVTMNNSVAPGTIIVCTNERRLYYVTAVGQAIRYPVGVGRAVGGDVSYHREIHLSRLVTTCGGAA
jgi:lipoprotein-anchoring transpeptidase ErfK/SrfK